MSLVINIDLVVLEMSRDETARTIREPPCLKLYDDISLIYHIYLFLRRLWNSIIGFTTYLPWLPETDR